MHSTRAGLSPGTFRKQGDVAVMAAASWCCPAVFKSTIELYFAGVLQARNLQPRARMSAVAEPEPAIHYGVATIVCFVPWTPAGCKADHQPIKPHRQITISTNSSWFHPQVASSTAAARESMKPSSPWTLTAQQVVAQQQTSLDNGLTAAEVQKRREQHGYNELDKEPGKPLWKLVLEQFDDMLVKVAAAALWRRAAQPVSHHAPAQMSLSASL